MDAHWLGPLGMPTRHVAHTSLGGNLRILLIIDGFHDDQTIPNS